MHLDGVDPELRELDSRSGDGFAVTLLWNARTDAVLVTVADARTGDLFRIAVDAADALDAFHHPYAYSRRLDGSPRPRPEWGVPLPERRMIAARSERAGIRAAWQMRVGLRRAPLLTLAVSALTLATALAQAFDRSLLGRLERTPADLHGEPWRIATALLVQDGGVIGAVSNIAFLAMIGAAAEQVLSGPRWLAQYVGVGLLCELIAYSWQPVGGGNSVAVCGLAGAVAVAGGRGDPRLPVYSVPVLFVWCGALIGTISDELYPPVVVLGAVAAALAGRRRERRRPGQRYAAFGVFATGVVLALATNIHGAALLIGIALALPKFG